jgi:hypothetical protein
VCFASPSIAEDYDRLFWPDYLSGKTGGKGVACLPTPAEFGHEIEGRLGKDHLFTTACQITESLFILLREKGGNADPLGVLDLTRQGGPIELTRGLPWVDRILKDKSGTMHIVVGGAVLRMGFYGSAVDVYSTKTWKRMLLARAEGIENGSSLECPEKGGYGYEATKQVLEEKHTYEDQNRDGFEDIVVETVETSCSTYKSRTNKTVFLATDHGFKEAAKVRQRH